MALILNGTEGVSDVDGSAATPAVRGTDTNTGIFFPAADTIAFAEGGVEVARITNTAAWSFGASGTATGTNGQVLTSAGSGAAPAWATPAIPPSGLTLISTVTASGASTVTLSGFSSTYDSFQIQVLNLIGGNSASLYAVLVFAAGQIETGYSSTVFRASAGSTSYNAVSGGDGSLRISGDSIGSSPALFSSVINLFNVNSAGQKSFTSTGIGTYGGGSLANAWGSLNTPTGAVTGIKFFGDTGTLTGTFRLYGLAK